MAFADEETFFVNTPVDASDSVADGSCDADGSAGEPFVCTLRAAIQEANDADTGTDADSILFDDAVFDGQLADTIDLGSALPTINDDRLSISGTCSGGPCAGIDSPGAGQNALTVSASNVSISRVSVTNAQSGIIVTGASAINEFKLFSSWVGIKLDGNAGSNVTGVFLDEDAQGAQLGDSADLSRRNVFGNNFSSGLRIFGADLTTVATNYFGVRADGATAAGNGENIRVEASGALDVPTDTQIGGALTPAEESSAACDGPCNVIANAGVNGVSLFGAEDATVAGNHVGLTAPGTAVAGNITGVKTSNSTPGAAVRGNRINGGTFGITTESGAANAAIEDNRIGLDAAGTAMLTPPIQAGLNLTSSQAEPVTAARNEIAMEAGGVPIAVDGDGAQVEDNRIGVGAGGQELSGGDTGIYLVAGVQGNNVTGNVIDNNTTSAIRLEGSAGNTLTGNRIGVGGNTSTPAGIVVGPGFSSSSTGNAIGGTTAALENSINNTENAISIASDGQDANTILRNRGTGNSSLFAELNPFPGFGNDPATGPNNGIQAPTVTKAQVRKDKVKGTGVPGAIVRVYRSSATGGSPPGLVENLVKYLGQATVGPSGGWKLNPAGKLKRNWRVSANQTEPDDDSSEFAFAKKAK
jgi:CSLREA domain-containing protein